ncbi:zinc finger protein 436-like isoform X5 [Micropterus salmoides]|uniref:zinc finger protein 436-like isoform X5 n=1 Tax=Micropterus salmoides TaxID=27706 RepID=UPI0018ED0531|nr:zinc finger protein 436-like isoform X5 [Micropterus salmoides]
MSKVQTLRAFVQQRLSAAAEEIFELFERTIAEYEEELCGQRKLLDAVFKPGADVQLLMNKEEVPPEQHEWCPSLDQEDPPEPQHIKEEWSPSLDQEDPPEPPHIKEEHEELWSSQEGDQLQWLEEDDTTKFTFTPVPVKSEEDDEEKPQSSQLHQRLTQQMETEADGEDCGGPEPARNSDPDRHLQPDTDDKTSDSSEPETDDSCDWEETREPQSGSNPLQNYELPLCDVECNTGKTSSCSSECATGFGHRGHLEEDTEIQTGEKPLSCSVCGKRFTRSSHLSRHLRVHTGEKPFSCSVCKKCFSRRGHLSKHMQTHTGEKPFSCSICKKSFLGKGDVLRHMRIHTGEKPFSCSVCGRRFAESSSLTSHFRVHTGEKPFSCSVCKKSFSRRSNLSNHMRTHTGEKPFICSICDKRFTRQAHLKQHKCPAESKRNKSRCLLRPILPAGLKY